jgi:hypothetical protein
MEPPFKLTRESQIRIDRDGHLWHEGERVEHPALARALASWVDLDPETGRYILRNSMDWCFVTVDDAPLVVRIVTFDNQGALVTLSDGSTERLDPSTVRIDPDDVPYCSVRGGRLPARFDRTAAFTLLERAHAMDDGFALSQNGVVYRLKRVSHQDARRPSRGMLLA